MITNLRFFLLFIATTIPAEGLLIQVQVTIGNISFTAKEFNYLKDNKAEIRVGLEEEGKRVVEECLYALKMGVTRIETRVSRTTTPVMFVGVTGGQLKLKSPEDGNSCYYLRFSYSRMRVLRDLTNEDIDRFAFREAALELINYNRVQHKANPLKLNETLNRIAQDLVDAAKGEPTIQYVTSEHHFDYETGTSPRGSFAAEMAVKFWYAPNKRYKFYYDKGIDNENGFAKNDEPLCKSFAYMVWAGATNIGIGYKYAPDKIYVVLVYTNPDNKWGWTHENLQANVFNRDVN